jgi:hypothetical protein
VHIRRALLLFAIVLGMAALVASLSRPVENRRDETTARGPSEPGPATATPSPAPSPPSVVSFDAVEDQTKRLNEGTAATVEVSVAEAGNVQIPGLGLSAPANPLTPARFDILATDPGDYELLFAPAGGEATEAAGKLVVTSTG